MVLAVVFDLDGVLFDHVGSARRGVASWLSGLDVSVTDELVQAWFDTEERHIVSWREGHISWAEQRRRRLRDFLPLAGLAVGDDDALDQLFTRGYLPAYEREWSAFSDVPAGLQQVRGLGLPTGVLTNGAEAQQLAKLARLGLLETIGPVLTAEALGVAKPEPSAFLRTCERMAVRPDEVLYVGDDWKLDVRAGRAAGLQTVLIDPGGAPSGREPLVLTSLAELGAFVRSLSSS